MTFLILESGDSERWVNTDEIAEIMCAYGHITLRMKGEVIFQALLPPSFNLTSREASKVMESLREVIEVYPKSVQQANLLAHSATEDVRIEMKRKRK